MYDHVTFFDLQWKISALKGTFELLYMSKVGRYTLPIPGEFFSFFFKQTRASWSEDMDYIEKMYMFGNFRYLSQRGRVSREGEFQEREMRVLRLRSEKVVSRLNR